MTARALLKNYGDASRGIIAPQLAPIGRNYDDWINYSSKKWQLEACVQIRRYQSRECRDGIDMDTSYECWKTTEVKPFTARFYDRKDVMRYGLIGAAAFESVSYTDGAERIMLQYCWLHPFYRGQGLLKKVWPQFEQKFGAFRVSCPRTAAMMAFLKSVSYDDPKS